MTVVAAVVLSFSLIVTSSMAMGDEELSQSNTPSSVDLATVPLDPDDFPEPGYQLAQAGDIEFSGLKFAWSDGGDVIAWEDIANGYEHGYTAVYVLLSDRGDSRSEPLASVTTYAIGFDSPDLARSAGQTLLEIAGYGPTAVVDGVTVYEDITGVLGYRSIDHFLVMVQYASADQQFADQQNTEDWTPESISQLVRDTGERLDLAIERVAHGGYSLGFANVMFHGPDATWTLPWIYYPNTEHYRVLDGETLPYGGELDSDVAGATPGDVDDLFVSRQQVGQEGYEHLIDVTLASFDSEEAAAAFAAEPLPIVFPPTWRFDVSFSGTHELGDGARLERAVTRGDELQASGYRTVRLDGAVVQVVQWLASGNALVSEGAILWLTDRQSACLDALPKPCAPIAQEELPAAIDERGAPGDQATPGAGLPLDNVLASPRFGWQIPIPDDGWSIVEIELFTNAEYFQLQSGLSLLTVESVVDRHGDPQQCVLDNLALLETLEERAVIDLGSDDPEERAAGIEQDRGWAIYTVEPLQAERADQEYTIRYDCYTLVEGEASLVVTHTAPRSDWVEERDKGDRFRDGIDLRELSTGIATTPLDGDEQLTWRTRTMGISRIWIPLAA